MGGFVKITPKGEAGPQNANYITRPSAAEQGEVAYHNAPEDVEAAETWEETRVRLRSWAEQVKMEERARHGNRAGRARTHYRAVISYEEKIEAEAAREDAEKWLEEEFPEAQAVGIVHQDTDQTHVHIWMSARKLDGKKVHISNREMKELHATFDSIYERRMGVRSRNAEKIEETRRFKRRYAELREQGADATELKRWAEANRPDRADPPGPEVYRERDKRRLGQGTLKEARRDREPREHQAEVSVEREKRSAERKKKAVQRKRERLERVEQEVGGSQSGQSHEPGQSHGRNEGGSSGSEPRARGGAREAEPGEREAEGAGLGERDRGGQGGDQRREGGDDRGDEVASGDDPGDRAAGLEGKIQRGGGGDASGERDTEDGDDHQGRDHAGSDELVDHLSDGPARGSGGAGGRSGADRGDELDRDAGADRGGESGGGDSAAGGARESDEVEEGEVGRRFGGERFELEMSERQEMIRDKIRRLVRLRGGRPPQRRSQPQNRRIREAREGLILDLDDPVYREEAQGKEGPPEEILELAGHLDGKEEEILKESWNYVASARNQGRNALEALREGWTPGGGTQGGESQSEDQGKAQGQDKSQEEGQGQDGGQSQDRSRGGRTHGR